MSDEYLKNTDVCLWIEIYLKIYFKLLLLEAWINFRKTFFLKKYTFFQVGMIFYIVEEIEAFILPEN